VLLEYEWMLFDVEIDEAVVPAVEAGVVPTRLRINPTARWLATPFDVLADDALSDVHRQEGQGSYAYAIYRTAEHRVLTQPLGERDIAELRYFDDGERRVSPADRTPWLSEALQRELVVASRARIPPSGE